MSLSIIGDNLKLGNDAEHTGAVLGIYRMR
jgi:hypothetical protein